MQQESLESEENCSHAKSGNDFVSYPACVYRNRFLATSIFHRVYEVDRKAYGESNATTADALRGLAFVYRMSKDYPNAEKMLLQVVEIYKTMYGAQDESANIPMSALCQIYEQWGKSDKAQSCRQNLVAQAPR